MKKRQSRAMPTAAELEQAVVRERYRLGYLRTLQHTLFTLVTVAALSVLLSVFLFPVLRIQGTSMTPALESGDLVLNLVGTQPEQGDMVAFYYNNKILVKRVIAVGGQTVELSLEGDVYVDGVLLEEPYLTEKALGDCDIQLPYQVPEGRLFVMGDSRSTSQDSRSSAIGCVSEEMLVGVLKLRIWPLEKFGAL